MNSLQNMKTMRIFESLKFLVKNQQNIFKKKRILSKGSVNTGNLYLYEL